MPAADLVHISYGGLGGHMGVVNTLTRELAKCSVTSGVVAVGHESVLDTARDSWPGASWVEPLVLDPSNKLRDYRAIAGIARGIRASAVLAHTHRLVPGFAAGLRLKRPRPTVVVVEHQTWNLRTIRDDVSSVAALSLARGLVFLSEESRAHYRPSRAAGALRRVTRVIPNGLDISAFCQNPALAQGGRLRLGTAGRLIPAKGLDLLIKAVRIARDDGLDVELVIAGEGPERQSLAALAVAENVAQFIVFAGHVPSEQMPEFFAGLNMYVHASEGETLSMALLEAAASRLPIVAFSVPGVDDVYTDGVDALLVPPQDPVALAVAIRRASDPDLASLLGGNARRLVEAEYSSRRMAEGYLDLLRLVAPRGPWGRPGVATHPEAH